MPSHWLEVSPYQILNQDIDSIFDFLFIYHAIGNFCLWGTPRWHIITESGIKLEGTNAIIYKIINRLQNGLNFEMTFSEFKNFLEGNNKLWLIKKRFSNLKFLNRFMHDKKVRIYKKIKGVESDIELLGFLIKTFPYLEDTAIYKAKKIYFYKKAQLFAADLIYVINKKLNKNIKLENLVGCSDYVIPQVLHSNNFLIYDQKLDTKIESGVKLEKNSVEEIEIRASTLEAIDYIYNKLDKKYSKMEINNLIWLMGHSKEKPSKKEHHTLTSNC